MNGAKANTVRGNAVRGNVVRGNAAKANGARANSAKTNGTGANGARTHRAKMNGKSAGTNGKSSAASGRNGANGGVNPQTGSPPSSKNGPSKSSDPLPERVRIRRTKLGKGVFAARGFRRNQVIGQMLGKIILDDGYDPRYCVDMGRLGVLEPGAPFRFLNHSCAPNCALIEWEPKRRGGQPRIFVHALTTIREDEQLTIDYRWSADAAIPCLCGADKCRGWIVDPRELRLLQGRRPRAGSNRRRAQAS